MMLRTCVATLLSAAIALWPQSSPALVNPLFSMQKDQGWFAQIYVDRGDELLEFCKGALIHERWVLTSGYCIFDPLEALGPRREADTADYVVRFFGSDTVYEVESFIRSPDLAVGMMKLKTPAMLAPLPRGTQSAAQLLDAPVFILGTEATEAVGDIAFNPGFGKRMRCIVDNRVFFTTGAVCYVVSKPIKSLKMLETRATVIDPAAPGAPNTPLDVYQPFDTTGKRLYLDFRVSDSYACHEDLGAPILRKENDTTAVVGLVTAVGMAAGLPLCGPTLANGFSSIEYYREFIDLTIAQGLFEAVCPAAPKLQVDYTGGAGIRLSWDAVPGAAGYKLFYTARVGVEPFAMLDVGNITEISTQIAAEPIYRAAIVAYNADCTSTLSEELAVAL